MRSMSKKGTLLVNFDQGNISANQVLAYAVMTSTIIFQPHCLIISISSQRFTRQNDNIASISCTAYQLTLTSYHPHSLCCISIFGHSVATTTAVSKTMFSYRSRWTPAEENSLRRPERPR